MQQQCLVGLHFDGDRIGVLLFGLTLETLCTGNDLISRNWRDPKMEEDTTSSSRIPDLVDTAKARIKHHLVILHVVDPRIALIKLQEKFFNPGIDNIVVVILI